MLELLIALFLVGFCALPLARMPMKSLSEQYKSATRVHMRRLANLAFKEVLEKLYINEIAWKDLGKSQKVIIEDVVAADIPAVGKQKFERRGTLSAAGKKGKNGDDLRLVTFKIRLQPENKPSEHSPIFTYKVLAKRPSAPPPPPPDTNPPAPGPELSKPAKK